MQSPTPIEGTPLRGGQSQASLPDRSERCTLGATWVWDRGEACRVCRGRRRTASASSRREDQGIPCSPQQPPRGRAQSVPTSWRHAARHARGKLNTSAPTPLVERFELRGMHLQARTSRCQPVASGRADRTARAHQGFALDRFQPRAPGAACRPGLRRKNKRFRPRWRSRSPGAASLPPGQAGRAAVRRPAAVRGACRAGAPRRPRLRRDAQARLLGNLTAHQLLRPPPVR
jgi:hypothetical protein